MMGVQGNDCVLSKSFHLTVLKILPETIRIMGFKGLYHELYLLLEYKFKQLMRFVEMFLLGLDSACAEQTTIWQSKTVKT